MVASLLESLDEYAAHRCGVLIGKSADQAVLIAELPLVKCEYSDLVCDSLIAANFADVTTAFFSTGVIILDPSLPAECSTFAV